MEYGRPVEKGGRTMKKRYGFVILNYRNVQETYACVASIRASFPEHDRQIVIVDNGSECIDALNEEYGNDPMIRIYGTRENLGFAKANNFGYRKLRKEVDYVIICNSDVLFEDRNFLDQIDTLYDMYHFDVLGPDVINIDGVHMSPMYNEPFDLKKVDRMILSLKLSAVTDLLGKLIPRRKNDGERIRTSFTAILDGSCYIYGTEYLKKHDEAFYNETFLFCEEMILRHLIDREGGTMMYSDSLYIIHKSGKSIEYDRRSKRESRAFFNRECIKSLQIFRELLLEEK